MATISGLCRPSSGQDIYKNLNVSIYDILFVNSLYKPTLIFYNYLDLTMACIGRNYLQLFKLVNHKIVVFGEVNI
jgi:hypothetical protein